MSEITLVVILALLPLPAILSRHFEGTLITAPLVLCLSLLLPIVVFDYSLHLLTYATLISSLIAFCAGYYPWVILKTIKYGKREPNHPLMGASSENHYKNLVKILFLLAQVAFMVNLNRVVGTYGWEAYLTTGAKDIEVVFGRHTIINYVYFLNIYVAALCVYLISRTARSRGLYALFLISTIELLFMGIKSTFIFGASISFFVYLLARRRPLKSLVLPSAAILVSIAFLFSAVNLSVLSSGADVDRVEILWKIHDSIRDYIYYNYINIDLELGNRTTYTYGKYTFFFLAKLMDPGVVGYYDVPDFILFDEDYNMGTFIREYFVDFGIFGALIIPFVLGMLSSLVTLNMRRYGAQRHTVFLAVLMTACAFAFFGNQFIRLQFIYIILVAYCVDILKSLWDSLAKRSDCLVSMATKAART